MTIPVEGPVRLGQTAYVSGPRVRVDRVIDDSRCPVDGQCVWAGRLTVRATVLAGGCTRQVDLALGLPVGISDGKLTLVEVTPNKKTSGRADEPLPYRFTFDFQGGL